jgi:hypothetical protein
MSPKKRLGFTLVELIVVILIIFLLIALLLPATRRVREPANRMLCASNMRQLVIALHNYHSDHNAFPTGCIGAGTNPESRLSWVVAILPYIEEDSLFKSIDMSKGYGGNLAALDKKLKKFQCPSAEVIKGNESVTHYVALSGIGKQAASQPNGAVGNGFMGYDRSTTMGLITVKDGMSNTIAIMETLFEPGPWARGGPATLRGFDPTDLPWGGSQRPFWGPHSRAHVAMADASIRDLPSTLDPKTLAAAITIAGGEKINWSEWE